MRIICRVCLLLAPLSFASMISPTNLGAQLAPHSESLRPDQIPFRVAGDNMLLVDGEIGGRQALPVVVDTGTPTTLVDQKIVRSLGLESQPKPLLHFGRTLPAGWVILPNISFGPVKAIGVNVGVVDLSFTRALGAHVDAIIGLDLLRRRS